MHDFTKVQQLNLSLNEIVSLPEWFEDYTELSDLNLSSNRLSVLPDAIGRLPNLRRLILSDNSLTFLPDALREAVHLQVLDLSDNQLATLPEWIGHLSELRQLYLSGNQFLSLPVSLRALSKLEILSVSDNQLHELPEWIGSLANLQSLSVSANQLASLPESLIELARLKHLDLSSNSFGDIPITVGKLFELQKLDLDGNPLTPDLAAAYQEGHEVILRFLRAKAEDQIVLNEAKLILVGEGEVGKTSLLGALRGDEWVENRPTTHGIEVDISKVVLEDSHSQTAIAFNGWDFGGQNIYRHTHQLFFTAPAVYLAVWNPRRGPEQCCVDEWIKMVRQRAFDDARPQESPRILIVATHGGPQQRSAHIDEQAIRDEFGDLIASFPPC